MEEIVFEERKIRELRMAVNEWEKKYQREFQEERKSEDKFVCDSGIPIKRVYTPLDLVEKGIDYLKDLGLPGEFPYTRGITPTGYRKKFWEIGQYGGHATPEESNSLWKQAIEAGADVIFIAYDLPTQLGLDPGNPRAEGEVGRVGVSLVSQQDWEIAFEGIDITKLCISQVANAHAIAAIANHVCLAEKRGADLRSLRGRCQNDVLKEYLVRGNYIFAPEFSLRLITDIITYCAQNLPSYDPITVCSAHYSESQCTPVHDAAFALADAFCYLQAAVERGIDIDLVSPHVGIFVGHEHYGFFQEIAKMRAIRRIWARVLKERFGVKKPESLRCKITSAQGGNSLQRQQYLNNIGRTTISILVAVLGGAEAIDLRTYDEQFGIPSVEAIITNVRLQHVVAQETGIADVVDPLGGSYFIESLTSEFEERINKVIAEIESRGGVVKCIDNGYMKNMIMQDAYKWQLDFESGKVVRVGANFLVSSEEERPIRIYRADPKVEQVRIETIKELKQRRNNAKVREALGEVKATALLSGTAKNNLMPPVIEAVKNYATMEEIFDTLREVWGEYSESKVF
jgi:methylmalonyl-CoA mutase N-terminal domain/subunit